MHKLPCGCRIDGSKLCEAHQPRVWGDAIAADPAALFALVLFIANVTVWCAILG